ncbi:DUF6090 family protein [Ichthyenterobacterium sp. W332]|uniref:DUF6090 family protein n=1 Tax=Microcosmobacter mediterraneus TaxID=3075607 RepID=A0ABU2YKT1_9FLAO|nr:DUF6090 family protein [Ichthyenterobacterium sp. W332]MDT0558299.1 DUF6090 family protein [Ichthyenterobacterium sp. W332]
MIKFFRHIRRSLINQNKMSKYFKYAIGEILLVVIGILIALQINNWNENRKQNNLRKTLTTSIQEDLKADINYLNKYTKRVDTLFQTLKDQSAYVNRISYSIDSLVHFLKNDINIFIVSFKGFNNTTYESMKTSGQLNVLDELLKKQLYELYILQNVGRESYISSRNDYFDEIENIVASYPIPVPFSFIKKSPHNEFLWDNLNKKDLLLKLNSWGSLKANFFRTTNSDFKEILDKTKAILQMIEENHD